MMEVKVIQMHSVFYHRNPRHGKTARAYSSVFSYLALSGRLRPFSQSDRCQIHFLEEPKALRSLKTTWSPMIPRNILLPWPKKQMMFSAMVLFCSLDICNPVSRACTKAPVSKSVRKSKYESLHVELYPESARNASARRSSVSISKTDDKKEITMTGSISRLPQINMIVRRHFQVTCWYTKIVHSFNGKLFRRIGVIWILD